MYPSKMLSNCLGTVNDFHWGFKPVLHNFKLHYYLAVTAEDK